MQRSLIRPADKLREFRRLGRGGQDFADLQFPFAAGVQQLAEAVKGFVSFAGHHIVESRIDLAFVVDQLF